MRAAPIPQPAYAPHLPHDPYCPWWDRITHYRSEWTLAASQHAHALGFILILHGIMAASSAVCVAILFGGQDNRRWTTDGEILNRHSRNYGYYLLQTLNFDASDETALHALNIDPAQVCDKQLITGGLSGAQVQRLTLANETAGGAREYSRRILKQLAPLGGWLGAASHDTQIREAQLWSSGLLTTVPASIATGYIAYAAWGKPGAPTGGALLLRDERSHLLPDPLHAPPGRLPRSIVQMLDRLAQLHARYWNAPQIDDPTLGLMPPRAALMFAAPADIAARIADGDTTPYLPLAAAGWDAFFRLAPPDAAATLQSVFRDPAPIAAAIATLPRTLVHGDVWGPNLGWLPATHTPPRMGRRLLLLDWALATAGPCAYDPLMLCGTWHSLHPPRILAAYRAHLNRRLAAHGHSLPPTTWQALLDAGYLRTTLICGEAFGRGASEAPLGAVRRRAEARVRWWAERAAQAARRLEQQAVSHRA